MADVPIESRPNNAVISVEEFTGHNGSPLFVSLVVPVYNEASSVDLFIDEVNRVFAGQTDLKLELLFVNDGSCDQTLLRLVDRQQSDQRIRVIDLSRNFGKEAALTAGLEAAEGQVVVPLDVDLQDPPELILQMIEKWRAGYEVVLARRVCRASDSRSKRITASLFYRLHNRLADRDLPANVGDFRLMDRCVIEALRNLPESNRFMKGLLSWVGFRTAVLDYTRPPRAIGKSKLKTWQLWNLAIDGITSSSTMPLRIWSYLGFCISCGAMLLAGYIVLLKAVQGIALPGYASLMVAVLFLGGAQLMGIGVVGEYLGRTYLESKRRPVYIVRRRFESSSEKRQRAA